MPAHTHTHICIQIEGGTVPDQRKDWSRVWLPEFIKLAIIAIIYTIAVAFATSIIMLIPPVRDEYTQSISTAYSQGVAGAAAHIWWRTGNWGWEHLLETLTRKIIDRPLSAYEMKVLLSGPASKNPPARTKQETLRRQVDADNAKSSYMVSGTRMGSEGASMLARAGNVQGRVHVSDIEEEEGEKGAIRQQEAGHFEERDPLEAFLSREFLHPFNSTQSWKDYFGQTLDSQVSTRTATAGCVPRCFLRLNLVALCEQNSETLRRNP